MFNDTESYKAFPARLVNSVCLIYCSARPLRYLNIFTRIVRFICGTLRSHKSWCVRAAIAGILQRYWIPCTVAAESHCWCTIPLLVQDPTVGARSHCWYRIPLLVHDPTVGARSHCWWRIPLLVLDPTVGAVSHCSWLIPLQLLQDATVGAGFHCWFRIPC